MKLVFRYTPTIGAARNAPTEEPLERSWVLESVLHDERPLRPGIYAIYEAKDEPADDGLFASFELAQRLKVEAPDAVQPKIRKTSKPYKLRKES